MQQKLITFAVPCYNSAAYMRHCIETLLSGQLLHLRERFQLLAAAHDVHPLLHIGRGVDGFVPF